MIIEREIDTTIRYALNNAVDSSVWKSVWESVCGEGIISVDQAIFDSVGVSVRIGVAREIKEYGY
jgi:hypothetical protein